MTESISKRMGGSHIGKMSDKELRKLFVATLSDLQNLNTVVANLVSAVGNVTLTANNLVADIKKVSNNTNAANNTVQITAVASTINLNDISALNLAT
jgi:hypothetical protein